MKKLIDLLCRPLKPLIPYAKRAEAWLTSRKR